MPLTRIRGSVWDTSDNIVVNLVSDLPEVAEEGIIFVSGYQHKNDGFGGWYKYEISIPRATADGLTIVDPSGSKSGNGCWVRQNFVSATVGNGKSEVQIALENQTVFNLHTIVYTPGDAELAVYVQGLRLIPDDFEETNSKQVTLKAPANAEDKIQFIWRQAETGGKKEEIWAEEVLYDPTNSKIPGNNIQAAIDYLANERSVAGTHRTEALFINVKGETTFPFEHNTQAYDVFLNGIRLDPQTDYASDGGSNITLTEPIYGETDRLILLTYKASTDNRTTFQNTIRFTNVAGQSLFVWAHDPGTVNIYLNGSRLIKGVDYRTNGAEIKLVNNIATNSDILEGEYWITFNVANAVQESRYILDMLRVNDRLDRLEANAGLSPLPQNEENQT